MLVEGRGVDKHVAHGVCLLTQAALTGSKLGAYYLAVAYDQGLSGYFPIDKAQALFWHSKVTMNTVLDLSTNMMVACAERVMALRLELEAQGDQAVA